MTVLRVLLWVVGVALVLYGMHRLLTWADGRDLIYYRRRSPGTARAVMTVAGIFEPAIEHVLEEERSTEERGHTVGTGEPLLDDLFEAPQSDAAEPPS